MLFASKNSWMQESDNKRKIINKSNKTKININLINVNKFFQPVNYKYATKKIKRKQS